MVRSSMPLLPYGAEHTLRSSIILCDQLLKLLQRDAKHNLIERTPGIDLIQHIYGYASVRFDVGRGEKTSKFTICMFQYRNMRSFGVTAISPLDTWNDFTGQTLSFARAIREFEVQSEYLFNDSVDVGLGT